MITENEPNVVANSRYNINQTCALLNVSRKTLAKYTTAGQIKCGYRPVTMRKFYTGLAILQFWRASV